MLTIDPRLMRRISALIVSSSRGGKTQKLINILTHIDKFFDIEKLENGYFNSILIVTNPASVIFWNDFIKPKLYLSNKSCIISYQEFSRSIHEEYANEKSLRIYDDLSIADYKTHREIINETLNVSTNHKSLNTFILIQSDIIGNCLKNLLTMTMLLFISCKISASYKIIQYISAGYYDNYSKKLIEEGYKLSNKSKNDPFLLLYLNTPIDLDNKLLCIIDWQSYLLFKNTPMIAFVKDIEDINKGHLDLSAFTRELNTMDSCHSEKCVLIPFSIYEKALKSKESNIERKDPDFDELQELIIQQIKFGIPLKKQSDAFRLFVELTRNPYLIMDSSGRYFAINNIPRDFPYPDWIRRVPDYQYHNIPIIDYLIDNTKKNLPHQLRQKNRNEDLKKTLLYKIVNLLCTLNHSPISFFKNLKYIVN